MKYNKKLLIKKTSELNFVIRTTIQILKEEEIKHYLKFCNIPPSSIYYLRKYSIINKIGKNSFTFQREPVYYKKLYAALEEYRAYSLAHVNKHLTKKKLNEQSV